jgi:hypothetical protein
MFDGDAVTAATASSALRGSIFDGNAITVPTA